MAYTASAMSFQLRGLPVPVVFTGAMIPASSPITDAWENIFGGIQACIHGISNGVHIYFHEKILDPLLSSKMKTSGRNPFSERSKSLADSDIFLHSKKISYRSELSLVNVGIFVLNPGSGLGILDSVLKSGLQGLVLEHEGAEMVFNDADTPVAIRMLQAAQSKGIIIVARSRDIYQSAHFVAPDICDVGVFSVGNMTREAAIGMLHAVLGAPCELRSFWHELTTAET
ncbi:asparaginase domain-containing protein [Pseudomonas sp. CCI3.2]|uniref:asparaginase domain-containing protein n=1 Tax=unclassified Pseudomonas TaxID=196821 RepID=UPI002AC97731|nr:MULTISPECIES: asparaginase domain-containing protein [unclassified Pseudomonas]MEB0077901.1 asparaginase domain-containing protein [Pseudomonas sp. MH10out]MEB0102801.1 asparaginase domain-containing protein [Pseudomonas sp. CCI3.2]MEB0131721.1 asparaginase domain-containing protein [Pseudomonas sp. CCI2.4]MEB0159496.1 asparaginase domain-containing protein [Pseudomonas sp. AH2 (2023)]MEB0170249.1 asparaginase domain-containing protein [Pseudomonas sp. CCC4.4]